MIQSTEKFFGQCTRLSFITGVANNMRYWFLIIIWSLVISTGCETFTGYNYESESVADKSRVYGTVRNTYNTSELVNNAQMSIGYLSTKTDSSGQYDVEYIISTDDNRNQPVPIIITAPNYHELHTDFLVFPPESKLDLYLEYGAPIIEKIWIGIPEEIVHQVLITDYQGIENINRVSTGIYYVKYNDPQIRIEVVEMQLYEQISENSAYFYATAPLTIEGDWFYDPVDPTHIQFEVRDQDGFVTTIDQKFSNLISPMPLFAPDALP